MVVGDLHLWVRDKGIADAPLEYSDNLTEAGDESLSKVAADAFRKLTGGAPKGTLRVTAGAVGGQVLVDGEVVGTLVGGKGSFDIPMGEHKVEVKADGYGPMAITARVRRSKATDVSLQPKVGPVDRGARGRACRSASSDSPAGALGLALGLVSAWVRRRRGRCRTCSNGLAR